MIFIGIFIALAVFFYFQQRRSNRNLERCQNTREKFEELVETLKKEKEQNTDNTQDNKK